MVYREFYPPPQHFLVNCDGSQAFSPSSIVTRLEPTRLETTKLHPLLEHAQLSKVPPNDLLPDPESGFHSSALDSFHYHQRENMGRPYQIFNKYSKI